jgi:hypothetical protein
MNTIFDALHGGYSLSLLQQRALLVHLRARCTHHELTDLVTKVDQALTLVEAGLDVDRARQVDRKVEGPADVAQRLSALVAHVYRSLKSWSEIGAQPATVAALDALFPQGLSAVVNCAYVERAGGYGRLVEVMKTPAYRAVLVELGLAPVVSEIASLVPRFGEGVMRVETVHRGDVDAARQLATDATLRALFATAALHDPADPADMKRLAAIFEPYEAVQARLREHYRGLASRRVRVEEIEAGCVEPPAEVELPDEGAGGRVLPWPSDPPRGDGAAAAQGTGAAGEVGQGADLHHAA